ncbi:MAG: DUF2892 domain-containing protein [Opitutales bacterium]
MKTTTSSRSFNLDRAVFALAGTFILASVALGVWVTPWAFAFTAFVGANMLQAAFTGFCPAALILGRFGVSSGCAFAPRKDAE